ncbi:PSP1 domain-containing protein [Leadbettera azotonutricia]|uniref:Tpl protein n=1 Tax=Leadbettera azotonutricia (strain ATCC BAA-888 / DSM 13862 / ZAS-9) TaxID=545695 RepID=F5YBD1_LEAAZ|nr:regulatory iron-sulfur-containing complex subunit RicT [Leadbettera azotonutricia]AEF82099.1 Tpl protein [Leadbettera azotonutricia ZAS-9]
MSDQDSYEDIIEDEMDEDISSLEDKPQDEETSSVITGEDLGSLNPDTPVYRLRLVYSNETFLAVWPGEALLPGGMVVLPTRYGRDLAQVIGPIQKHGQAMGEFAKIDRPASGEDLEKAKSHKEQEKEAFSICREKIKDHRLEMKLVSVHYLLEESKILFFFTAENRVDFRELVKDLVGIFKTRIELRQIGVRDESRVVGGLGVCGRGYCCHAVSDKLKPVSIKMAKDQNLSLNSMKISGPCGRLLCCLSYEHLFYNEQRRIIPQEGCKISFDGSVWKVTEVNVVLGKLKLVTEDGRYMQLPTSAFEKAEGRWSVKPGSAAL